MSAACSLEDLLYSQGFGTRRVCAGLIQMGRVTVNGQTCLDAGAQVAIDTAAAAPGPGLLFAVDGTEWPYLARAYVMLHKPKGHECSHKPSAWPSVYTLLPAPLRQRPTAGKVQGVQAVGRLDQDTTGLLLLSDDGQFIHRMASPRHHQPKVYEVLCRHSVTPQQVQRLLAGVVLDDDPRPVRAAACQATGDHTLQLTLTEGKYHQVKRMLAAVGNRVEGLHRSRIGDLRLPADLLAGQWCWLGPDDLQQLGWRA